MTIAICLTAQWAAAQPLGSFTWQLQPFCNRVTVTVTQNGSIYTLDGTEDQCGAPQKAPLVGVAAPNPDGSIGFGLNIVAPSGQPVPVQARISIATLSGTWSDNAGNGGTFAFGANTGGSARPVAAAPGDVTGVSAGTGLTGGGTAGDVLLAVDPAVVQSRVTTACPAGQALRSIAQNGTAACEPIAGTAGGDITAVIAGAGLLGGAASGDATLDVAFGGTGTANLAARSDHTHAVGAVSAVGVGPDALRLNTGIQNTAMGFQAMNDNTTGTFNTAVGFQALQNNVSGQSSTAMGFRSLDLSTANENTGLGSFAMSNTTSGGQNTAIGFSTLSGNTTGTQITALGFNAEVSANNLVNATAIGARAVVNQSNSLVLGSINGLNGATSHVNVGIGTTTPQGRLEIATEGVANEFIVRAAFAIPQLIGRASNGTLAAPSVVVSGDRLMSLEGEGFDTAAFRPGANIEILAAEDWSTTAHGGRIDFWTVPNGSTAPQRRMTIHQDGRVAIGTTAPADVLHVNGDVRVGNCVRNSAGTQIAGTCASDARFKRDITPFPSLLDRVARLQPVNYFWRADQFPDRAWSAERTYGLVAQDVETVMPDLVRTMEDGYKAVDYSKLPLVLLQAVRELKAANDALTEQNAALARESRALADRLAALEGRLSPEPVARVK
ncbi:MAG: tail fiber domain-containing protein [Acidobacteriota bacterium]|nr:tail fiber domain-containing protein [Acidobacteriota bacterium]